MRTCDELGVCNGRHCTNVAPCWNYDLIACNSGPCDGANNAPCPHAAFECEVACAPDPAPLPTYPFAPGVIEGPYACCFSSTLPRGKELVWLLALVLALSAVGGLLAGLLAGWRA